MADVRRLRGEGLSFKKIQLATGVPVATMHKYLTGVVRLRVAALARNFAVTFVLLIG